MICLWIINTTMDEYTNLTRHLEPQIAQLNRLAKAYLSSEVTLINQVSNYIVNSGGKRLRPLLTLYFNEIFCDDVTEIAEKTLKMAVAIEYIHTATLLHDDVVDNSQLRRNQATANSVFGNSASILAGDFLYSRAFQIMNEVNSTEIMRMMADTTNKIAEGEVLQLMNCNNPKLTEAEYFTVVNYKTAMLFQAACAVPGILSSQPKKIVNDCKKFGGHIGVAFQLTDDLLDYNGTEADIGKKLGDDLKEGKATLPLIRLMAIGDSETKELLTSAIKHPEDTTFEEIVKLVRSSDAISYTQQKAFNEISKAEKCLLSFSDGKSKEQLRRLLEFVTSRKK